MELGAKGQGLFKPIFKIIDISDLVWEFREFQELRGFGNSRNLAILAILAI